MSDESALLAAILAHPDEDTPRLMYADWLDENGQPERAEFIRIQCDPVADEAADERAWELEERNRFRWFPGLPTFPSAHWNFRRGFPECLSIPVPLLLQRYDAFTRVPWVRILSLRQVDTEGGRLPLAGRTWNRQWVELELLEDPYLADAAYDRTPFVSAVADCSQVSQLRRLQLSLFDLTPGGIESLVASPYLEHLQQLHLDGDRDDPRFAPLRERFGDRLVIG